MFSENRYPLFGIMLYLKPASSATASNCSAWREIGFNSKWFAPAATRSSSRSRTCSGVPWMPEASVPGGLW
jgi:hypothetical protein